MRLRTNASKLEKLVAIAIGFLANYPIYFVGVLRGGELIALGYLIFRALFGGPIKLDRYVRISILFLVCWGMLGYVSSLINATSDIKVYKGLANVVFFGTSFLALSILFKKDRKLILYFLLALGIGSFFYNPYFIDIKFRDANPIDILIRNISATNFFDMHVAPTAVPLLFAAAIRFYSHKRIILLVATTFGLISVYYDAKSTGLIFVLGAMAYFLKLRGVKLSLPGIFLMSSLGAVVLVPILYFAASHGLLGKTSSQVIASSIQVEEGIDPMRLVGRMATYIALLAIREHPFIGYGFKPDDPGYVNLAINKGILPPNVNFEDNSIPTHSVILQSMVEGGVLAGAIWIYFLFLAAKALSYMYKIRVNDLSVFVSIVFFYAWWNIMFSPLSRIEFASVFAILIVFLTQASLAGRYSPLLEEASSKQRTIGVYPSDRTVTGHR